MSINKSEIYVSLFRALKQSYQKKNYDKNNKNLEDLKYLCSVYKTL